MRARCSMTDRYAVLAQICHEFNVAVLYAFGSRAQEVYEWVTRSSAELSPGPADVDVGVKAVSGVKWTVTDKVRLSIALEDLFAVNRVDLVVLNTADPFLAEEVIRGARLYARDEYEADEYDLYVLRRAGDLAPLEHEWLSDILRAGL